jgi:hypothetical protein
MPQQTTRKRLAVRDARGRRAQTGLSLIEIAVVLVVIGLLLGGVLKGQSMIDTARVTRLAAQQDEVKAAYLGFVDRFRALPGDFGQAGAMLDCSGACPYGNGNGMIESAAASLSGSELREDILAWTHLNAAGFLTGGYRMAAGTVAPTPDNNPVNSYQGYLQLSYDGVFGLAGSINARHNLKTGNLVPVELLAEVDRRIDDGLPDSGGFRFSAYAGGGGAAPVPGPGASPACTELIGAKPRWNVRSGVANCGAASLM